MLEGDGVEAIEMALRKLRWALSGLRTPPRVAWRRVRLLDRPQQFTFRPRPFSYRDIRDHIFLWHETGYDPEAPLGTMRGVCGIR